MNISDRIAGKAQIVVVGEDITHQNVREFSAYLDRLIERGSSSLVLDLGLVPYVTSRGLGAIVSAFTVLKKRGGNLVVLNPQPEVRRSFELTRLDRIMEIALTETEALGKLAS